MSESNQVDIIGTIKFTVNSVQNLYPVQSVNNINPYIQASVNSLTSARTIALPEAIDLTWNESLYLPVTSLDENLYVEIISAEPTTDDVSLGHFSLGISDLVETNESGNYLKTLEPLLRSSELNIKGLLSQGTLYYTVAFYPTLGKKRLDFSDTKTISSVATDKYNLKSDTGKPNSSLSNRFSTSTNISNFGESSLDQLVEHKAGVLSIFFIEAQAFKSNLFVRYLVDECEFPTYTSPLVRRESQTIDQTSSAVIRELDHSQITFELVTIAEKPLFENIVATYKISTLDLLQNSYSKSNILTINQDNYQVASITLRTNYTPLELTVDSTEGITNSGLLGISIVKAENISAKKSSQISTFVRVEINGESLLTTQAVKRTLNPVWNEDLNTVLLARSSDTLILKPFEKSTDDISYPIQNQSLGIASIDLTQLRPGTLTTLTLPLKGNPSNGTITISLLFKQGYVQRRVDNAGIASLSKTGMPLAGELVGYAGQSVEIDASELSSGKARSTHSMSRPVSGSQILHGTGKAAGAVAVGTGKVVYAVVGSNARVFGGVVGYTGRVIGSVCVGTSKMVADTGRFVAGFSGKVESGFKDTFKKRSFD